MDLSDTSSLHITRLWIKPKGRQESAPREGYYACHLRQAHKTGRLHHQPGRLNRGGLASGAPVLELRERLEGVSIKQLQHHVSQGLSRLGDQVENWESNRRLGSRRFAAGLQDFVESMDSFLSAFSGVVEVIILADAAQGAVAGAALAVFFAVSHSHIPGSFLTMTDTTAQTARLKASNDQAICGCMHMIANRLPSLDIYY